MYARGRIMAGILLVGTWWSKKYSGRVLRGVIDLMVAPQAISPVFCLTRMAVSVVQTFITFTSSSNLSCLHLIERPCCGLTAPTPNKPALNPPLGEPSGRPSLNYLRNIFFRFIENHTEFISSSSVHANSQEKKSHTNFKFFFVLKKSKKTRETDLQNSSQNLKSRQN